LGYGNGKFCIHMILLRYIQGDNVIFIHVVLITYRLIPFVPHR